ncbi:MAG: lipopolysaccharide biosynthesis protein [Thomasclavelia sp.]|nr:lipopolysaccharide biosynthesis protein [Thomasclavelia sp.]
MSREKTVLKNTLIMMFGTFLPRVINLLTTPIINGSISGSAYGNVELITNTILNFAVPLLTLQMEQALFRFLIDSKDELEQKKVITNGYAVIIFMMMIGALITLFLPIEGFSGGWKALLIGYIVIEIIATTSRFILRAFSKYKEYSILAGIVVFVNFGCVVLNMKVFHMGMQGVVLALTVADIVGFLYVIKVTNVFSYIDLKCYDKDYRNSMMRYALPFLPNQISWYINQMSDRWIISLFLGFFSNGVYSMANKIPSIVNILYPAFNLAWTDSAQRSVNDEDSFSYYNNMFKKLFCIISAGTGLLIGLTPIIFAVLCANPKLYVALPYSVLLVVATYFYCFGQFFGSIYVALKQTKNMSVTTMISAIINIVINLVFMYQFGVIIACISTFCANLFLAGYRYYDLNKRYLKIKLPSRLIVLTIFVFAILCVCCLSSSIYIKIGGMVLSFIYAWFIAGDLAISMVKGLINRKKGN